MSASDAPAAPPAPAALPAPRLDGHIEPATRVHVAGLETRPRPKVVRHVITVAVVLIVAYATQSFVTRPELEWGDIGHYMFNGQILHGVLETIEISAASLALGWASGLTIALMRLSAVPALRVAAVLWVWFFRAVPVLVVMIIVNNIALLYPRLGIGIPWGSDLTAVGTTHLMTPFLAAVLAFGANEGAYESEIFRAAIGSVPVGESEAARALGMSSSLTYRRVVLPQALKFAVPPMSNNAINMLKGTSIVSFVGAADLLYTAQSIYSQNYEIIPLLVVACLWYLILVTIMTVGQVLIERRIAGGSRSARARLRMIRARRSGTGV